MRVSRSSASKSTGGAKRPDKTPSGFADLIDAKPSAAVDAAASAAVSGVAGVGPVDAVLALQAVDSASERRDRALRKGRRMVDALDRLRLSMLEGGPTEAHLGLLQRASHEARAETGDEGLDEALAQIEQRMAVEIAKLEIQRR